jgi:hypothetical protein
MVEGYQLPMDMATVNINFLPITEKVGQKVDLYISCSGLSNLDFLSKSDPQVRVFLKDGPTASTWTQVGETEMIKDNLNPVFKKTVQVFYQFEINQNVRFEVIDDDEHGKYEIIGRSEIMMA